MHYLKRYFSEIYILGFEVKLQVCILYYSIEYIPYVNYAMHARCELQVSKTMKQAIKGRYKVCS